MSFSAKFLVVVAFSFALALVIPIQAANPAYAVAALVSVTSMLGVVFLRAVKRREDLANWVAVELNKIRRVYHLGKNLGLSGDHRGWFTELHGYVYGYLSAFDKKDLAQYQETNGEFRKVSYHLYTIGELSTDKEKVLYREMLEAAGEAASARQHIQELRDGGLPTQAWTAFYGLALLAAAVTLSTVTPEGRVAVGLTNAVLAVVFMIAKDTDQLKTLNGRALAERYVENIARLELTRHDEVLEETK